MGAQGTTTVNFGAFPGSTDTSVAVTGQTGIIAGSLVEAWILPAATADHSADEHVVEDLEVYAGNIVAGTGFTIYIINRNLAGNVDRVLPDFQIPPPDDSNVINGDAPMPYGQFNVAWVWN